MAVRWSASIVGNTFKVSRIGRSNCRRLTLKSVPRVAQFGPQLADTAARYAEPSRGGTGCFSGRQPLGQPAAAARKRREPLREVDPHGGRIGWAGVPVLDEKLLPAIVGTMLTIERMPLDSVALPAIFRQHV